MGTQLLSDALLDYRTKSRGGTGVDGITWKPLAKSTIRQKNRRAGQGGTAQKRSERMVKKLRKKGDLTPSEQKSLAKHQKTLEQFSNTEIGVDLGLQRASASPGYVGPDGKGGNLFKLEADGVTVGFNREYSEYFDAARPLLPSQLPPAWVEKQEKIVQEWAERIVKEGIGEI